MGSARTVLVGWELGAGRGHLEHLSPIIAGLLARGRRVVAAMRDVALSRAVFGRLSPALTANFTLCQAPILLHRAQPGPPTRSLAEAMARAGFGDLDLIRPVVQTWRQLIDQVAPDVVIADFAPSLVCAARGRVGSVVVGNGWTIPPDAHPVPAFPFSDYDGGSAAQAECQVVSAIADIAGLDWRPERFAHLLRGDRNFLFGHPWLDAYEGRRSDAVYWPPNIPHPTRCQGLRRAGVTVYLPARHPARANLIEAIAALGVEAVAYFDGEMPDGPPILTVSPTPLALDDCLPGTACFVHHGGLGVTTWGLTRGSPQVLLPVDLEKHLIARAVVGRGYGLASPFNSEAIARSIQAAMSLTLSAHLGARPDVARPEATIGAVIAACDEARNEY
jgi:rhamnosyltransferase subunit B